MILRWGLVATVAAAWPTLALAQTTPGKVVPPNRPDQAAVRPPARAARAPAPPRGRARQAAIQPFVLRTVVVEGSTMPAQELEAAWAPLVGQTFSTADLVRITDALARVYEDHDLAIYTVVIENQDLSEGVVRVRALEGRISGTEVVGTDDPRLRRLLQRYLDRMTAERPLRRSSFQRYVSLVRDLPGLGADVTLENGPGEDGVKLKLSVKPRPVQVAFAVNNRGTALLGRTQASADLYLNGVLRAGDQTRLTIAAPTEANLFRSYTLQQTEPLGTNGLVVTASASHLRTRPKRTDLRGRATSVGLQFSYPLIRSYDRDLYATVGVDGVDNRNAFLGFTFANDRTRAIRGALAYSQQSERRVQFASAAVSQGVNALGARTTDRRLGEPDFRKLNLRAGVNFAIGRTAALRLAGAAQLSADRLPSTELFSLGGDEFGRAFPASIVAGDQGVAGSAELAVSPGSLPAILQGSEAYGFLDSGKVSYKGRLGFPRADAHLVSAGAGVRAKVANRLLVQGEAVRSLANPAPGFVHGDWRGVFAIRTLF
jgi:hemolysin activation/secretion protein